MAYAEKRDGKATGFFYGEALVTPPGKSQVRFRHRFDTMKSAQGYEVYVKLMGEEPPTMHEATSGRTFATVATECKAAGGPEGKWLIGKDRSIVSRVDHVVSIVGHIDILQFKRSDFQLIIDDLRKRPPCASGKGHRGMSKGRSVLTNATINRYLSACSAVLTFAVQSEYREHKPEVPLLPEVNNLRDILRSFEQEDAILNAMRGNGDHKEVIGVRVLVESGLRRGELDKLKPFQITIETDAEQNEIGRIALEGSQTKGMEHRSPTIPADLAREARALIAAGTMPKGTRLLRQFKKARDACGYPENLLIHSLRHTRNTRLRKAGVDIDVRMQLLGHKSEKTSRRYDHIDNADQLEAAKKVEQMRGDRAPQPQVLQFPIKLSG